MNPNMVSVSVLLHLDGDSWVAQCLDYDVAAQGKTEAEAKNRFLQTLASQIAFDVHDKRTPLVNLPPAPQSYFDCLGNASEAGPALPVWISKEVSRDAPRVRAHFLKKQAA